MPWPRLLTVLTVPLALGAIGLTFAAWPATGWADPAWIASGFAVSLPALVLGNVIGWRRPHNPVGPLLALAGLVVVTSGASEVWYLAGVVQPGSFPTSDVHIALGAGGWMWLYVPLALVMLYFPDGRLTGPRWLVVAVGLPAVAIMFSLLVAIAPEPYPPPFEDVPHPWGTAEWAFPAALALLPVFLGLLIASAVSMVRRYRRADDLGRAQLKWFALAGLTIPVTLLLCWTSYLLLGNADLVVIGLGLMYVSIPAATAIAILRHDLYDVDRVISGTVTYAVATAVLLGVMTAALIGTGLVLGSGSPAVAAAATAVGALALSPLRRRLQGAVDRRFYPLRPRALTAIEDLRARTHAGDARPEQLETVLRAALGDPGLRVGFRLPGSAGLVDIDGTPVVQEQAVTAPVSIAGETIGAILFARRCPWPLAGEIADAAALLVEVVRLRLEVGAALREVESSRARLLRVGYAERRRLERDLHDGAQQRLVTIGMSLRLAQRQLGNGGVDVDALLDGTVAEIATAVAELRQIAHGLRPSSLDDGLGPALTNLTSTVPIPVELDVHDVNDLPDDITTTAYFVVSEAVTNTLKHADADQIGLHVAKNGERVAVRVTDNGKGGATMLAGSGLAGLSDRIAALGGSLTVHSPPGGGTLVKAELPCAS